MGGILDRLLALRGETVTTVRRPTSVIRRAAVLPDSEFLRIDSLPRRVWESDPELPDKVALLTAALKTPYGSQVLWPIQAVALCEASDCQGLVAGIRVGGGKTICSLATASVPGLCELARPVLFVPAKHRSKTERAYDELGAHWRLPQHLTILNYEELSDIRRHEWLLKYRPQLIVCDEAHKLKTDTSARRTRMETFLREYPTTVLVLWSGTFMRKSVTELRTPCEWALRERSPIPRTWKACSDWSAALDPDAPVKLASGALSRWCDPTEQAAGIVGVRRAVGRRIAETPGVIISNGATDISASLELSTTLVQHREADPHIATLRALWELPNGWTIRDAPVFWDALRQLSEGFYYSVDPWPPLLWMQARKDWHSLCRTMQADSPEDVASELMCKLQCEAMGAAAPSAYTTWVELEPTFIPNRTVTWISTAILERAAAWIKRHAGLVWVEHTAFGTALEQRTGVPYFAAGAEHRTAGPLDTYTGRNAICQLHSCMEGFNLQDRWHSNLVVTPHPAGVYWEQLLARTHRYGQRAETVSCEVLCKSLEDWEALLRARAEESNVAAVMNDPHRKLVVADWLSLPDAETVRRLGGAAWRKRTHSTHEG